MSEPTLHQLRGIIREFKAAGGYEFVAQTAPEAFLQQEIKTLLDDLSAVLDGADPEPTITREWVDGLIERALKAVWGGAYDCDDPDDDCQDFVEDDRESLKRAVDEEMADLRTRMKRHADGEHQSEALEIICDAILAALSKEQT